MFPSSASQTSAFQTFQIGWVNVTYPSIHLNMVQNYAYLSNLILIILYVDAIFKYFLTAITPPSIAYLAK